MNKQDIAAVVALFLLLLGWFFFQQKYMSPPPAPVGKSAAMQQPGISNSTPALVDAKTQAAPQTEPVLISTPHAVAPVSLPVESVRKHETQEPVKMVLSNGVACVTVSSWGGGISGVELKKYRSSLAANQENVTLDFSERPALALSGLAGLDSGSDFNLSMRDGGKSICVEKTTDGKIHLERTLTLGAGYRLDVTDVFRNDGAATVLPVNGVGLGPMRLMETKPGAAGISYIGVDTLEDKAGVDVRHWGKSDISALFGVRSSFMSCARQNVTVMPVDVSLSTN